MKKSIKISMAVLLVLCLGAFIAFITLTFVDSALVLSNQTIKTTVVDGSQFSDAVNVPYESDVEFAKTVHVSPSGDDNNDGSSWDKAVLSVKQAQILVREFFADGASGNALILLDDGEYFFGQTMNITLEDVSNGSLYIRSRNNNKATISGSEIISKDGIVEINDENLGRVWKIPCAESVNQLYINNQYATRARFPNSGEEIRILNRDTVHGDLIIDGKTVAQFKDVDFKDVSVASSIMWGGSYLRLNSMKLDKITYKDSESGLNVEKDVARLRVNSQDLVALNRVGMEINEVSRIACHFENSKAFLDTYGEWYYDDTEKVIYYLPFDFESLDNTTVRLPKTELLISSVGLLSKKIENVVIEGVNFKYTANTCVDGNIGGQGNANANINTMRVNGGFGHSRPVAALYFENVSNVKLSGNIFECIGGGAIDILSGANDVSIEKNLFNAIGGNGVLAGTLNFDINIMITADTRVYNNRINTVSNYFNDIGWQEYGGVAVIYTYAADSKINYNTIDNVKYSGISAGWGWDTTATPYDFTKNYEIAYNRISNTMNFLSDGGSIYTIGVQEGTSIHDNYIYDANDSVYCMPDDNVQKGQKSYASASIYLDNTSGGTSPDGSGFRIYNNYLEDGAHFQDYLTINARPNGKDGEVYWSVNDSNGSNKSDIFDASGVQEKGFTLLTTKPVLRGYNTNSDSKATVFGNNLGSKKDGALILINKDGEYEQLSNENIISWSDSKIVFNSSDYISGRVYYISKDGVASNLISVTLNVDRQYCMIDFVEEEWGGLLTLVANLKKDALDLTSGQIKVSSVQGAYTKSNLLDLNQGTLWACSPEDQNPWIEVSLEVEPKKLSEIILRSRNDGGGDIESRKNLTVEINIYNKDTQANEWVVLKDVTEADNYSALSAFVINLSDTEYADTYIYGVRIRKTTASANDHFLCLADLILVA